MSDVGKFISMVGLHFPPPRKVDDPEYAAWLTSMTISLRHYSDSVLAAAAADIVQTRTAKDGRFFPLPSECAKVCDRHRWLQEAQQRPLLSTGRRDGSPWAGWRVKLAGELIVCELGRQAKAEGWILALYDFARANARLPAGGEIDTCKAVAKRFDEAYEACRRGDAGELGPALTKLGRSMIERRKEIAGAVR